MTLPIKASAARKIHAWLQGFLMGAWGFGPWSDFWVKPVGLFVVLTVGLLTSALFCFVVEPACQE